MKRPVQITIYEITGETDPICLSEALNYFIRNFNKGKRNEKTQSQSK